MADDRIIKTTIELSGEGSYANKLKEIEKKLKQVNSVQKVVSAQYSKDDQSLAALTARQGALQDKMELQRKKLELVREEYEKTVAAQDESSEAADKLARDFNNASAQLLNTEKSLKSIEDAMTGMSESAEDTGNAAESAAGGIRELSIAARTSQANIEKAEKASKRYKTALEDVWKQTQKTSNKMANALGAAEVGAVTVSIKEFMTFEQQMSKMETLVDQGVKSMSELSDEALAASDATGVAAADIVSSAYDALSSGVDTANVMDYMTKAAKAAKAGQAELSDTVNGSTSIMNAWKIAYSESGDVFNKLLVAQDKGKTTLGEISQSIGQITGVAPQLNVSLEETLAAIAALTKNGVQTSSAITGLRAVMSSVLKPTAEAAEEAARLGLEFDAAALQSKGLTGFLADIMDKTEGSSESLAKLFGSVEGLSQIMLLGGTAAADYEDALSAMANSSGKLEAAFNTTTSNRADQLSMALNRLKNNAIEFGGSLAPYIDMATDALGNLTDTLSGLSAEEMKGILQTGLFIAAALKIVGVMSKITAAAKTTAALFSGPAGWIGLAVAGITGLISVLSRAETASDRAQKAMAGLFEVKDMEAKKQFDIEYEAQVSVTRTGDMSGDIEGIYTEIETALTDGLPDTPEVVGPLKRNVEQTFGTAINEVETWVNQEIAKLDINSSTYDTDVENIKNKGKEMVTSLEDQQAATILFISEMAGKSTEEVQARLGELATIEEAVQATIAEIERAKNLASEQGRQSSEIVKSGGATNTGTIGRAFGYEQNNYKNKLLELEAQFEQDKLDLEARYDELGKEQYQDLYNDLVSKYETDTAAALSAYQTSISELMLGLGKTFKENNPKMAEEMQQAVDDLDMAQRIEQMLSEGIPEKIPEDIQKRFAEFTGSAMDLNQFLNAGQEAEVAGTLVDFAQNLTEDASKAMEKADLGMVGEAIGAAVENKVFEGLENVDLMTTEGQLKAIMKGVGENGGAGLEEGLASKTGSVESAGSDLGTAAGTGAKTALDEHSPSKVFKRIGENAGQGLANGLRSKYSTVYSAAKMLASAAEKGAKITLEVKSPSKVFKRIGEFTAEGMIQGVRSKASAVDRAMRSMVNPAGITGTARTVRNAAATGSRQDTVVNNINVRYSGAFTRNEARRFGAALNDQMAAEAAARGN